MTILSLLDKEFADFIKSCLQVNFSEEKWQKMQAKLEKKWAETNTAVAALLALAGDTRAMEDVADGASADEDMGLNNAEDNHDNLSQRLSKPRMG